MTGGQINFKPTGHTDENEAYFQCSSFGIILLPKTKNKKSYGIYILSNL